MKPTSLLLAGLLLTSSGCVFVPSPYAGQLQAVSTRYTAIENGFTRSQIEARLGKPTREAEAGSCVWETRFDDMNYALLQVWFDAAGKAVKVETTRAHGKSAPGFHASAVTTRTK